AQRRHHVRCREYDAQAQHRPEPGAAVRGLFARRPSAGPRRRHPGQRRGAHPRIHRLRRGPGSSQLQQLQPQHQPPRGPRLRATHAVTLRAIALAQKPMRIGSPSTILSTSDPVRVFENFATIDLISGGRAELVAGRASRVGLFELLGYDLRDYEELFEEKFDLLQKINQEREITWSGQFRAPLNNAEVLPRPAQESLPIWRAVGGAPASAIKAGLAGVPMVMAHLGGT